MIGITIGNGTSREGFDLNLIKGKAITIGCNSLYKDFEPDYLVAIDPVPDKEVREYRTSHQVSWKHLGRRLELDGNWGLKLLCDDVEIYALKELNGGFVNNSGLLATAFMAEILKLRTIYLLGVDFFLGVPGKPNDIYGGNFGFSQNLVDAWNFLIPRNPKTKFYRVGPIPERNRAFYETQRQRGFNLIESFDEFLTHLAQTDSKKELSNETRLCEDPPTGSKC